MSKQKKIKYINSNNGFTLIELMIAVAVIGILSSFAITSYVGHIRKSNRITAVTALNTAAQYLERNMTANNCYNYTTPSDCAGQTGTLLILPANYKKSSSDLYNISLAFSNNGAGYTLTATPDKNKAQKNDICGVFTLNNVGIRTAGDGTKNDECWGGH